MSSGLARNLAAADMGSAVRELVGREGGCWPLRLHAESKQVGSCSALENGAGGIIYGLSYYNNNSEPAV